MIAPLTLIAAVAKNGVIGKDNRLLWQLPGDLKRFKQLTLGHAVIMGRKTWESLPERFRPLPGRVNIVVTRDKTYRADGATIAHSLADAIAAAGEATPFVIGGGTLYAEALPLAERLELTELHADYDGDTHFPALDPKRWREAAREPQQTESDPSYDFVTYLPRD